jgi:hypothetical protein
MGCQTERHCRFRRQHESRTVHLDGVINAVGCEGSVSDQIGMGEDERMGSRSAASPSKTECFGSGCLQSGVDDCTNRRKHMSAVLRPPTSKCAELPGGDAPEWCRRGARRHQRHAHRNR